MGDYFPAEIHIGGPVKRQDVKGLCEAIRREGVSIGEYGGPGFEPETAEDLLEAARECDGVISLYDDDADGGMFEQLEEFCEQHDIPFTRKNDAKYEHRAEVVEFRAGWAECQAFPADNDGNQLVDVREIEKILDKTTTYEQARTLIRKACGLGIPPLPKFCVI